MRHLLTCAVLAGAALVIYGQTHAFDFVDFDDNIYYVDNERLGDGLSPANVAWAFTTGHHSNWHPVTWLSILLDYSLFGESPGAFHLTNALIHLLNAWLLYFLLFRMTGARWRSLAVAALFVAHPLHVESVAWISERKDVLAGLFWLLSFHAYASYIRSSNPWRWYALLMACFALGLMSKPMALTLPLALLLADYWPLDRWRNPGRRRRLFVEKAPLAVLSALSAIITLTVQEGAASVQGLDVFPLGQRLGNALASYVLYLWQAIWPARLAVYYPHPRGELPAWEVALCAAILAAASAGLIALRRTRPHLLAGWLFYLITLLPVIGILQVGAQAMADRYTYIPLTGVFTAAVWELGRASERTRTVRAALAATTAAALVLLTALAWRQTGYWRNTQTLFVRAVEVTQRNALGHDILGRYHLDEGRVGDAISEFEAALGYNDYPGGKLSLAQAYFAAASEEHLLVSPESVGGYYQAGRAHLRLGQAAAAVSFRAALEFAPGDAIVQTAYGNALQQQGLMAKAVEAYRAAIEIDNDYALAHLNLGLALHALEEREEAAEAFDRAVTIDPSLRETLAGMGIALETAAQPPR